MTKLPLKLFVSEELLNEDNTLSMPSYNEAGSAYKNELLEKLKYMQAFSQTFMTNPNANRGVASAKIQEFLSKLDVMEQYFNAHKTTFPMAGYEDKEQVPGTAPTTISAAEIVQKNKIAFLSAVNNKQEFVPLVWSKALETPQGTKLAPKYYGNTPTIPAQQRPGAMPVYANNAPFDKPIALDTTVKHSMPLHPRWGR